MDAVKVFFFQNQGTFFFGGGEAGLPPAPELRAWTECETFGG